MPARRCLQHSPGMLLALLALNGIPWANAVGLARRGAQAPIAPSGVRITPVAAAGAAFSHLDPHLRDLPRQDAGQAVTTVTSAGANTLPVLTSGYNRLYDRTGRMIPADSEESVVVYDIRRGRPEQRQVLRVADTYMGIAFAPDGRHFYVSGGVFVTNGGENALAILSLRAGRPRAIGLVPMGYRPNSVSVSADGRWL